MQAWAYTLLTVFAATAGCSGHSSASSSADIIKVDFASGATGQVQPDVDFANACVGELQADVDKTPGSGDDLKAWTREVDAYAYYSLIVRSDVDGPTDLGGPVLDTLPAKRECLTRFDPDYRPKFAGE